MADDVPELAAVVTENDEDSVNAHSLQAAACARAFLIGKLVLIPKLKLKASGMFQPEDHASSVRARYGRMGTVLNYGGIFSSGYLLFWGHAAAYSYLNASAEQVARARSK